MLGKVKVISGIVLLFVLFFAPMVLAACGIQMVQMNSVNTILIHEAWVWSLLFFMSLYCSMVEKRSMVLTDEHVYPLKWYLKNFVLLYFSVVFISFTIAWISKFTHSSASSPLMNNLLEVIKAHRWMVALIVITAGVTEEILIRGYLLNRFEELFRNPVVAILFSSVVFALLHMGYGTWQQLVFPLLLGVLFAWHYYKYRNLRLLILLHVFIDFVSLQVHLR